MAPPLPLEEWEDTKETHVTLYVTPRGLTTGPIPHSAGTFDISFDLLENRLAVTTSEYGQFSFALHDLVSKKFLKITHWGCPLAPATATLTSIELCRCRTISPLRGLAFSTHELSGASILGSRIAPVQHL